jgi:hypothetical protein
MPGGPGIGRRGRPHNGTVIAARAGPRLSFGPVPGGRSSGASEWKTAILEPWGSHVRLASDASLRSATDLASNRSDSMGAGC